tara:strand:+ start:145 stop:363 length:219 start_codon:yes stop_codon:yes gene_type:complete
MSHYYEQEQAFQAKQEQQQKEAKLKLFYNSKLNGIQMMTEMLEQELSVKPINSFKVKAILDQVVCLATVDED